MKDILKKLNAKSNAAEQKFRNVRIFPKILEEKSSFTPEEKKRLTEKGLCWYIYYDYKNPVTGKFVRQQNIRNRVNQRYPDFDSRLKNILLFKKALIELLESGEVNPYVKIQHSDNYVATSCLEHALSIKKSQVANRTFESYEHHINQFKEWLTKNHYNNKAIDQISKKVVNSFLNHISKSHSNRTSNNFKSSLSAIFTILVKEELIDRNFIVDIENLKTTTKPDPTWSEKHVLETDQFLTKHDPTMFMFIRFVDYMFWRPKENCRLQVKDVNLEQRLINTKTKTKGAKTKLIPEILLDQIAAYIKGASPEDYLFTPKGPGPWDRDLDGRRSYFTLKFRRYRKRLGLPEDYTI